MFKHCEKGLAALAAGIAMLVTCCAAHSIGCITGAIITGVARQPEIFPRLKTALLFGNYLEMVVLVAGTIIAVLLLHTAYKNHCCEANCTSGFAALGAAISILSAFGMCLGIRCAFVAAADAIARQPESFNYIMSFLSIGSIFSIIALAASFTVSLGLVRLAYCSYHSNS